MRANSYKTKSQIVVLEYLKLRKKKNNSHVTPKEITSYFQEQNYKISTATIYRVLEKLEREGVVKKYLLDGMNASCYEYIEKSICSESSYHLKCDICGEIVHFNCSKMNVMKEHLSTKHGFDINTPKTIFYGKCSKCNNKENKEE